ncbi:accessory Sec system translocase SecA2 [Clostridium sp. D2Q-11]|uniref:Protein translocase subunit SecA n=1 Tax=Anaeromonas frigoriresistens TaxID=2683708 RepID=A0A942UZQ8_9FIRM|nr:accessory Sec system translocase SecA2 [Anaeromonas frigoriresistens]MBS4538542.1 accessory Sec system translocase SecA2 [Anaeromonas frigoriresistens]
MPTISKISNFINNIDSPVNYNIAEYIKVLDRVNNINLKNLTDNQLKEKSEILKRKAKISTDDIIVDAFSLVRETSRRVLGMYPFDTQILAGAALDRGKIVEMKTGEGKTLSAIMPAYLNGLTGKGVHILTYNDYLAARDAEWMGNVYKFLGIEVSFITEKMSKNERKKGYLAHITYLSAKESGFDYLRDFLAIDKKDIVHRPFNYAIIDEADSILIDEARVPLVIAGKFDNTTENYSYLSNLIKELHPIKDYELNEYGMEITLTEEGLSKMEYRLGCDNLYEDKNLELLTRVNSALHAEVLLQKDKHYIVRNNKVEIVDEFTGRVSDKRSWPDNLQDAVEAKEGIKSSSKGKILGSIPLQYFINLYPKVAGMTGTAHSAARELDEFYGKDVVIIPTNKTFIRKDKPHYIFKDIHTKKHAILHDIKKEHEKMRPILIGTGSVEESENLAMELRNNRLSCNVINAKNDEIEADIIAKAGELGAITVSTNMAGRGVDIKLGGKNEKNKEKIISLGGLYILGTNLNESRRIDNQLRGRAGRQGEPGESRFYVSLEDELIRKYRIDKLIPSKLIQRNFNIEDDKIREYIDRGQRIVEGYNSDIRRQLMKYSFILEEQRSIIHKKRREILEEKISLELLSNKSPEKYKEIQDELGKDIIKKVEKQLTLYYINKCWADYLEYISYIRESIHLVVVGKKNPLDEFHKIAIESFDKMLEEIEISIVNTFKTAEITKDGIDMDKERLKIPSSTWTYLIDDSQNQFSNVEDVVKSISTAIAKPFISSKTLYKKLLKIFN